MVCGASDFYPPAPRHGGSLPKQRQHRARQLSENALARVWKAQRFSWGMTAMLHTFRDFIEYDQKLQDTDLACGRWT